MSKLFKKLGKEIEKGLDKVSVYPKVMEKIEHDYPNLHSQISDEMQKGITRGDIFFHSKFEEARAKTWVLEPGVSLTEITNPSKESHVREACARRELVLTINKAGGITPEIKAQLESADQELVKYHITKVNPGLLSILEHSSTAATPDSSAIQENDVMKGFVEVINEQKDQKSIQGVIGICSADKPALLDYVLHHQSDMDKAKLPLIVHSLVSISNETHSEISAGIKESTKSYCIEHIAENPVLLGEVLTHCESDT